MGAPSNAGYDGGSRRADVATALDPLIRLAFGAAASTSRSNARSDRYRSRIRAATTGRA